MVLFIRREHGVFIAPVLPEKIRWYTTMQLDNGPVLTLVDDRSGGTQLTVMKPPRLHLTYPMPILKSNLQKTVRRCERTRAIRTAWQMLRQDPLELLRRLPVIIAEDTLIQPELYVEIVWMMAAVSKGYNLTWEDAEIIMAAVATSVEAKGQYNIDLDGSSSAQEIDLTNSLALALQIRISFGGMKYDSAFLTRLLRRLPLLPLQSKEEIHWVEEDIEDFNPETDVLLEAIDQHVFPSILRDIADVCPKMIWWCRSEPNERPYRGEGAHEGASLIRRMRDEHAPMFAVYRNALDIYARRKIRFAMIKKIAELQKESTISSAGTLDNWFSSLRRKH